MQKVPRSGLTLAKDTEELRRGVKEAAACDTHILIEEFISGRELTVAISANRFYLPWRSCPSQVFMTITPSTQWVHRSIFARTLNSQVEVQIREFAQLAFQITWLLGLRSRRFSPQSPE